MVTCGKIKEILQQLIGKLLLSSPHSSQPLLLFLSISTKKNTPQLRDIAKATELPHPFLAKLVQLLVKVGVLNSIKGSRLYRAASSGSISATERGTARCTPAAKKEQRKIPIKATVVSLQGEILQEQWVSE